MADIFGVGVSHFRIGLMKSEPEDGTPTYNATLETNTTNSVNWAPATANATADGDNKQVANISVVTSGTLTWKTWGMPDETYASVFGHSSATSGGIQESFSDIAPYVGVGYVRKKLEGSTPVYTAYFYYKAQAVAGEEEQTTQGTSLNLSSETVTFNVSEPVGYHFRDVQTFDTEAEANKSVDGHFTST